MQLTAETWTPQQVLSWAFDTFGNDVAISSAFGAEGMVLIDMASRLRKDFRLFTVDTEFLFSETYNLMDRSVFTVRPSGRRIPTSAAICARLSRSAANLVSCVRGSRVFAATRLRFVRMPEKSSGTLNSGWSR